MTTSSFAPRCGFDDDAVTPPPAAPGPLVAKYPYNRIHATTTATTAEPPKTSGFQLRAGDNTSLISAVDVAPSAPTSRSICRMASSNAAACDKAASRVRWDDLLIRP